MNIFLCEDSLCGIFSAIYKAWEMGTSCTDVQIKDNINYSLFDTYIECLPDEKLAEKVTNSIISKLSYELYYYVYCICMSDNKDKASVAYKFLQLAFRYGTDVLDKLTDNTMISAYKLKRAVSFEACRYREFIRFEELDNGVLWGRIEPANNIVAMIANHFADRLFCENWIITDTKRNISVVHAANHGYVLTNSIDIDTIFENHDFSAKESDFQALWKRFFDTIAIKERINPALQQSLMPLKFRKYMNAERMPRVE